MTIGARPDGDGRGGRVLTTVPRPGAVLVTCPEAPTVAGRRSVDVVPGPVATFDGDRVALPLHVRCGDRRRRFARHELADVEALVTALLRRDGPAVVRFGDRAACRRVLPTAALERRLGAAARRAGETLVTWTSEAPLARSPGLYDAVLP